ncbi:Metallo-dependent phosphatase-like protein [Podospora australis]|uniref:Metallo-dependent phosphatase-like protein n=1 Tax=Podospora australis TaxID=1536484 RepID=A0AAN6X2E2_9PEZI|nr:Metallo-dependent phosphatase-like protein [Podospora australis]
MMMIPPPITHMLNHRPPRTTLFLIFGGISFLTLCLFTLHLPVLNQFASTRIFGSSSATAVLVPPTKPTTGMTSSYEPAHLRPQPPVADNLDGDNDKSDDSKTPTSQSQMPISHNNMGPPTDNNASSEITHEEEGEDTSTLEMTTFTNHHPPILPPPVLLADLPHKYLPISGSSKPKRLIILGDVHGHLVPLKSLLSQLNFNHHAGDHAIFAGDLITKGPDSRGVIQLAMNINASAVRGNHEDRVLAAAHGLRKLDYWPQQQQQQQQQQQGTEEEKDVLEEAEEQIQKRHKDRHARDVAKSLTKSQLRWIEHLPIILRLGSVVPPSFSLSSSSSSSKKEPPKEPWNAGQITVVHGGLVPGVPFEKQEPWAVMNMRSLVYPARKHRPAHKRPHRQRQQDEEETETADEEDEYEVEEEEVYDDKVVVPVDTREGEPWSKAWNRFQNKLSLPAERTVVIYGHDAKMDLQTEISTDISPWLGSNKKKPPKKHRKQGVRYAFGLDSGCGRGRRLSALVIEAGPDGVEHRVESIDCGVAVEDHEDRNENGGDAE